MQNTQTIDAALLPEGLDRCPLPRFLLHLVPFFLLALWGLTGTSAPVGWWAWIAKVFPKDAEAGGGLFVAVVQLSIALGSTLGGILFDHSGYRSTFSTR